MTADAPPRARRRPKTRALRHVVGQRWYTPYTFLLPGLVMLGLMFAWPAFVTFQLAFSKYDIVHPARWIGAENFTTMFSDPRFYLTLANTGMFLLMYLPLVVIIPLLLAILVNTRLPGIHAFRMAYYLPVVTSMVAVAVAWKYLLNQEGVINWILRAVTGTDASISFLLDTTWALPSVVAIEAWKSMGLYMMIYLAGLQAVPSELIDAARVDGANTFQRFRYVTLPAMAPYVAVTLTLGMLDAMRSFEAIYMLTQGGPEDATLTIGYYVWQTAFRNYDMGYASAIGLVMWAIMIVLALLNQLVTRRKD